MSENAVSKFGYFRAGDYLVDVGDNRVFFGEQSRHIEPKAMQVLYHLALNAGETVSRQELMEQVWHGRVVMEDALTRTISQLRVSFNDNKDRKVFQTIPKKGYRLSVDVVWLSRKEFIAEKTPDRLATSDNTFDNANQTKSRRFNAIAVGISVSFVMVLAIYFLFFSSEPYSEDPIQVERNAVRVALLPWRNLTGDDGNDYLAEMLPEELSIKLSNVAQVEVLAHYSALALAAEPLRLDSSYVDQLDAKYIIEGSITDASKRLRILVRLVDKASNKAIWSEVYEDEMSQLIPLQHAILADINAQLLPNETSKDFTASQIESDSNIDIEAYQFYLQGNYWLMNGKTSKWFHQAKSSFLKATQLDPNFDAAFGNLAFIYARYNYHDVYMPQEEAKTKSRQALQKALSLNPNEQNALISQALLYTEELRFDDARKSLLKVLAMDPKHTRALYVYSELALAMNDMEVAIEYAEKALKTDPLSPWVNVNKAIVHFWRNDHTSALESVEHAISIDPNYTWAYVWKARILQAQAKLSDALEAMRLCMQIDNGSPTNSIFYALMNQEAGLDEQAKKWFSHAASLFGDGSEARFWQNYLAIDSANYDPAISLELLAKVELKHTRFFTLYPLHLRLIEAQPSEKTDLLNDALTQVIRSDNDEVWVNHRNYDAAFLALKILDQSIEELNAITSNNDVSKALRELKDSRASLSLGLERFEKIVDEKLYK